MHWPDSFSKQVLTQFGRFALVGILATLTHLGTLTFLVEVLHCHVLPASTTGFALAVIVSYILNSHWTFKTFRSHRRHLPRYVLVCIIGFMVNTAVILITVVLLHWWYVVGQLAALAIVPFSNFILNRYWVFNSGKTETIVGKSATAP